MRQGPLRLRVGALATSACARRWCATTASSSRCRGPRRSTPRPPGSRRALDADGPASIAVLGGARGTNEDAYVWARFAKGVLGTDNVDAQLGDGLPAEVVLGLPRRHHRRPRPRPRRSCSSAPTSRRSCRSCTCACAAPPSSSACRSIEIAPRATGLTPRRHRGAAPRARRGRRDRPSSSPGRSPATAPRRATARSRRAVSALDGRDGDLVVVLGRQSLAESPDAVVQAAAALAALPDVKFLSALRRGNVHGALDLGLAPGFLPGRVTLDAGRDHFTDAWGAVPAQPGLDAAGILDAARRRRASTRWCCSAPTRRSDFPDRIRIARRRSTRCRFVIAVGAFAADAAARADVFLPTSVWGEKAGSTTNLEGRVHAPGAPRSRPRARRWTTGASPRSWRCASAPTSGSRPSRTCRTRSPASRRRYAGVDAELVAPRPRRRGAPDRRLPRRDRVPARCSASPTGRSWEPITPGVAADESHLASLGPARSPRAAPAPTPIKPGLATATARGRRGRRTRSRRHRRARGAPALHAGTAPRRPGADAARRVQSPPRGRPHALRRRTHRRRRARRSPRSPPAPRSSCTRATSAASVSRRGRRRARHQRARHRHVPVRADAATAPGTAFMPFAQGGAVGPERPRRRHRRRSPSSASRPRGERASGDRRRDRRPAVRRRRRHHGRADRHRQDDRGVRAAAALGAACTSGSCARSSPSMQNRIGPDRAGPVRAAPDAWPTASSCSSRSSRCPTPPTGAIFRLAPYLVAAPRVPRVRDRAHRRRRDHRRAPRRSSSSPTSRSGSCGCSRCRASGSTACCSPGWSSGSKYPLLGSVRASAQLLSYEAAFGLAIVGVLVQSNTLSTRGIVDQAGLGRHRVDLQRRLVLAAGDRRAGDLRDRRGRRDQPPAVRPRRSGAGAHRRLLHRVHRHQVRDLLPRRVHERHHDVRRSR